jgi:hypothetical protein
MSSSDVIIYFDERQHKYTDNLGNTFTSVTTVIPKYHTKFDTKGVALACEKIGRNPNHPKYLKYKGKSVKQIIAEWDKIRIDACENGSRKHDYLETSIKSATGYNVDAEQFINGRIYTITDIINATYGELNINWFITTGIAERYPQIYKDILVLHNAGFKFYAEVGVYNVDLLISGLIDLLAVKDKSFIIIDWKTNRADIRFESGYYNKDENGELTNEFIYKNDFMSYPLQNLADSVGNHYNLQVSGYAWLCEQFGLTNIGNLIYQIRDDKFGITEKINRLTLNDYRSFASAMFQDHFSRRTLKSQILMFN